MAFIPEDGSGVPNANSLATVEFADNYHAERGNGVWANLDLEVKRQKLIVATDYIAGIYASALDGIAYIAGQVTPFPRVVGFNNIGNPIPVQQATAELALIAVTTPLMPNITRGKKKVKVGPIEVEYDGNSATQTQFVAASLKLAPYLRRVSGAMAKLVRS